MKTFSKSALAISVAAIALAASSASFGAEINLTLAHALNETHSAHIAMKEMADLINKNSNGRIEVQIFPNGQMGTAAETLE
ncbi:MAG TPA: C4-dicarboxylate ABC transporter substrate-binding protein, partial [Succinivibrionaceae bacterium]|nr:C4-dicarboxylate ABC transporter substrate-binding protein [Succinivibrionaceae bacterium]